MKNSKFGTPITGNFTMEQTLNEKEIKNITKKNNVLVVITTTHSEVMLIPNDDSAELIVQNFSNYSEEDIESIYSTKVINYDSLVIILYMFKSVQRIEIESETQHFYLDRLETNRLISKGAIIKNDEIGFLNRVFMDRRSVFVIEENQGIITNKFQMFSNEYIANCERERPGVIKISRLREYKVINRSDEIIQWFGNIKFVKFDDAMQISGNDIKRDAVKTDDIFLAWNQYLDFKKQKSDDGIRRRGFLRYKNWLIKENRIFVLEFDKEISEHRLFQDMDNDVFDIIVYEDSSLMHDNIEDILSYKRQSYKNAKTIEECANIEKNMAYFDIPDGVEKLPKQGIVILSDRNLAIEQRRRQNVVAELNKRTNPTANMIMRLTAGEEDSQTGSEHKPVTADVLEKMFGEKHFEIKENYREAMHIAINTPDLALIQGPPGTGKTTLIKGIAARLNSLGNKNYKIHVSSEQHEALNNVVEKLSSNKLIPPFISSKRYGEKGTDDDNSNFKNNVGKFQSEFTNHCEELLKDKIYGVSDFSQALSDIIYRVQEIRASNYNVSVINDKLPLINENIVKCNMNENVKGAIEKIYEKSTLRNQDSDIILPSTGKQRILKKLESQRLTIKAYNDDGAYQLAELQRLLKKDSEYLKYEINRTLMEKMKSGNGDDIESVFDEFVKYIEDIKKAMIPEQENDFDKGKASLKSLFDDLMSAVQDFAKNREKDFYDIVEELKYKLIDTDNVITTVKRYTNIIGSTCAQAYKSIDKTEHASIRKFDYVIIDEAARANPLDIMIPIMLGTRVILVGDQMQLPHFIEKEAREFNEKPNQQYNYDGKLLEKALFGLIYERVEKSWNENKLKFKRHIRINEQHRMHPVIGDFISKTFYNGTITNGEKTIKNTNCYSICNSKNVAWFNIPVTSGLEEGKPSYYRIVEVKKVMEVLGEIISNLNRQEVKIGIISFYKRQAEIISGEIRGHYPQDVRSMIECATVDSFQGKEFDIVILSTVRSNVLQTAGESLGFIHYSISRINVALSRAKRLLIVVGDANTFSKNDIFNAFIKYVKKEGFYV